MANNDHTSHRNSTMLRQTLITFAREQIELIISKSPGRSTQEYQNEVLAMIPSFTDKSLGRYKLSHEKLEEMFGSDDESESLERAFWSFFHEALADAKDTDPNGHNNEDIHFFYNVVRMWRTQSSSQKLRRLRNKVARNTNNHPAPLIPPDVALPLLTRPKTSSLADDENARRGVCGGIDQCRLDRLSLPELEKYLLSQTKTLEFVDRKLSDYRTSEHTYWLKQIKSLVTQRKCSDTKIAFVGATGAGKSSLINALLGEKLLPQSSRQACTPFLTEVKYNESSDLSHRIRMIVHFIDRDSWACEVKRFLAVFHTAGSSEEALAKDDIDFKLMRDKIRILCPDLARTSPSQMCSDDLVEHNNLVHRLGQSDIRHFSSTKDVYKAIDGLIKGRTAVGPDAGVNGPVSLWPLIKCVEVEVRNDTLKHGLTVVDLPGIHDSNKARSSIAKQSMKDCSAIYIVAPMIRAADDASAGTLLSAAFEHQFHLDNLALTFVCTKSDDIGFPGDEAADLGVEEEVAALQSRNDEICAETKATQLKQHDLSDQLKSAEIDLQIPKSHMATYQRLRSEIMEGRPQLPPVFSYAGNKRKHGVDEHMDDVFLGIPTGEGFLIPQSQQISTIDDLDRRMDIDKVKADFELKSKVATALTMQMTSLSGELLVLKNEQDEIKSRVWQLCIVARNEAVKSAVRGSVAEALKQFQEQDPEERKNRGAHARLAENDADDLAESLPVIMVSSKAYEYLCRKQHQSDSVNHPPSIESFTTYEQTGIPSLIDHCVRQAQTRRRSHAVRLLNKIEKARNGLHLSISGRMFRKDITEEDLALTRAEIDGEFLTLSNALETEIKSLSDRFIKSAKNRVLYKFPEACNVAINRATEATRAFGNSVKSSRTYKAILVRDGSFTSSDSLSYDFNSDILQLVMNSIGPKWKSLFAEKLPEEIARQQLSCRAPVNNLRYRVLQKANELGCSPKTVNLIQEQYERHMHEIEEASNAYHQSIQFEQRRARAVMYQTIKQGLLPAYAACADIRGKGAFVVMKRQMIHEIDGLKSTIFDHATKEAKKTLEKSLSDCARQHGDDMKDIIAEMKRTYESVFRFSETKTNKADLDLEQEILDTLEQDVQQASAGELKTIKAEVEAIWNNEAIGHSGLFVDEE